jgi:hypothetical protein
MDYKDIGRLAERLVGTTGHAGEIPVPIENIIEELGLNIVPMPGLKRSYDIEGFLTPDRSAIYVDEYYSDQYEARARFTLAHELGHWELHREFFEHTRKTIGSIADWVRFLSGPSEAITRMEYQAYCF